MAPGKEYTTGSRGESFGQAAAGLTERAKEVAGSIKQTIDSTKETVQDGLRQTRESANKAVRTVADGIETSTEYFTERGMERVMEDVNTLIRRYPFHALFLGLAVGYLFFRNTRR